MLETILFASHHAHGNLLLTDFCALQYTYKCYQAFFYKNVPTAASESKVAW